MWFFGCVILVRVLVGILVDRVWCGFFGGVGFFDCATFWLCEFDCTILMLVLVARVWCGFFSCESLVTRL